MPRKPRMYLPNTHRLDEITGAHPQDFDYDAAGNTILRNGTTHVYDPRGRRLAQGIAGGPATAVYLYNALGQRAIKVTATEVIHYIYDLQGQLLAEMDAVDNTGREYAFLSGEPLAAWRIDGPLPVTGYPAISPPDGSYSGSVTVSLTAAAPGDKMYYSIDEGETFNEYIGQFVLTESANVYAVSTHAFYQNSLVAGAGYTVTSGSQSMSFGGGESLSGESLATGSAGLKRPKKAKPGDLTFVNPAAAGAITALMDISGSGLANGSLSIAPVIEAGKPISPGDLVDGALTAAPNIETFEAAVRGISE